MLVFLLYFCRRDDIYYRFVFFTWIFQLFNSQLNLLHDCFILLFTKNTPISTKIHLKHYLFISAGITKQPSNNMGQPFVESKIGILLQINRFQVDYINLLLYAFSVSVWPIPERAILGNFIEDLTLRNALLWFTLLRVCKRLLITNPHFIHESPNHFLHNLVSFMIV